MDFSSSGFSISLLFYSDDLCSRPALKNPTGFGGVQQEPSGPYWRPSGIKQDPVNIKSLYIIIIIIIITSGTLVKDCSFLFSLQC